MTRNLVQKYGRKVFAGVALITVAAGNALAAVSADVTTAMTDMKADGITVATAFLVASIVIMAFLFMRKGAKG